MKVPFSIRTSRTHSSKEALPATAFVSEQTLFPNVILKPSLCVGVKDGSADVSANPEDASVAVQATTEMEVKPEDDKEDKMALKLSARKTSTATKTMMMPEMTLSVPSEAQGDMSKEPENRDMFADLFAQS